MINSSTQPKRECAKLGMELFYKIVYLVVSPAEYEDSIQLQIEIRKISRPCLGRIWPFKFAVLQKTNTKITLV